MTPIRQTKGSLCADLVAEQNVVIPAKSIVLVGTGWFPYNSKLIELEHNEGYLVFARSSLCKRGLLLANGVGVIDSDYEGEVMIPLYNTSDTPIDLQAGTRIAQTCAIFTLDVFPSINQTRGEGGFGSTGAV